MIWIILALILFYFILRPAWRVYKAYRDPQKAMEEFRRRNGFAAPGASPRSGDPAEDSRRSGGRKAGWSAPRPRKKKIDPAAGDYVRFTNLPPDDKDTSAAPSSAETTIEVEQQTVDVTWEEVRE